MRQLVYAVLPLGVGIIADPFMGSGATVAAAEALGISSFGVERDLIYYQMSCEAISQLASLSVETKQSVPPSQLTLMSVAYVKYQM